MEQLSFIRECIERTKERTPTFLFSVTTANNAALSAWHILKGRFKLLEELNVNAKATLEDTCIKLVAAEERIKELQAWHDSHL